MSSIHPTAVIHPKAQLGADVSIGPFAYLEEDVVLGDGCRIGAHVSILRYTTLGAQCQVHAGAVLGDLPQDLSFGGGPSYVRIGRGCVIREGVTVHRGTKPETATVIGDDCFLMAFAHFGHNVTLGKRVIVANAALLAGYVDVGDGAFISGNVSIHQFCRVGRLAMLGGTSGISQDVLPFVTTEPMVVNRLLGLNVVGLRRAGVSGPDRLAIKHAWALLFRSHLPRREAVQRVRESSAAAVVQEIAAFAEASKRGLCSPRGASAPGETTDSET